MQQGEVQVTQYLKKAFFCKTFLVNNFNSIIFPRNNAKAEIIGKARVEEWPATIHLCMMRPVDITEETLINGLEIRKARYRIKGIIHCRGQEEWLVSIQRAGDWYCLGKGSVPEMQAGKEDLLSGVVLIQLLREDTEGQGLTFYNTIDMTGRAL